LGFGFFARLVGGGFWAWLAVGVAAAVLLWEHVLVGPGRLERINAAFFTANGLLSLSMLALFLLDIMSRP